MYCIADEGSINNIAVLPAFRRMGIGARILGELVAPEDAGARRALAGGTGVKRGRALSVFEARFCGKRPSERIIMRIPARMPCVCCWKYKGRGCAGKNAGRVLPVLGARGGQSCTHRSVKASMVRKTARILTPFPRSACYRDCFYTKNIRSSAVKGGYRYESACN